MHLKGIVTAGILEFSCDGFCRMVFLIRTTVFTISIIDDLKRISWISQDNIVAVVIVICVGAYSAWSSVDGISIIFGVDSFVIVIESLEIVSCFKLILLLLLLLFSQLLVVFKQFLFRYALVWNILFSSLMLLQYSITHQVSSHLLVNLISWSLKSFR